jgi:hypothetical protein
MILTPDVVQTIKMTDFTALVTINADGTPHLVAGWNCLPRENDILVLSGERFIVTRRNLARDPRVWVLVASHSLNTGYRISASGRLSLDPADLEVVHKYWPRCTFAILLTVEKVEDLVYWRNNSAPINSAS